MLNKHTAALVAFAAATFADQREGGGGAGPPLDLEESTRRGAARHRGLRCQRL